MNIIGQHLDLKKISEEYFEKINLKMLKPDKRFNQYTITYTNGAKTCYQQEHSVIALFDLELEKAKKNSNLNNKFITFLEFIFDKENDHFFLKELICGKPNQLAEIIKILENKRCNVNFFHDSEEAKIITKIFNYNKLVIDQGLNKWICNKLELRVCPYCNAQYVFSVEKTAKFQLDHFYPQAKYPYLMLSFFNLIPSCANCNHKKRAVDTYKKYYLTHPYEDSFHEKAKYITDQKMIKSFIETGKFRIEELKISLSNTDDQLVGNHDQIFDLEEIANVHKDIVIELYMKAYIYCDSMKTDLAKSFIATIGEGEAGKKLALFTEDEINRIVFGNYIDPEDFHKRPLSKLTRDIAEELELVKSSI